MKLLNRSIDCAHFSPTCRQSSGTQPRCIKTSKTSRMRATAVVDDERGHEEKRRESTSGSESTLSRRKSWNPSNSQPNTDAEHVLTVEPSIARPQTKSSPEESSVPYSTCNTQAPRKKQPCPELDDTHEDCNCGTSTVFCTVSSQNCTCHCSTTGMSNTLSKNWNRSTLLSIGKDCWNLSCMTTRTSATIASQQCGTT